MRLLLLVVVLLLSSLASVAAAQTAPASDGDALVRFMAARVRAARQGEAELVEVPLAFQSDGWGCVCPINFLGDSGDGSPGDTFLTTTYADGVYPPTFGRRGGVLVVEGYFTGNMSRFSDPDSAGYDTPELYVTKIVRQARVGASLTARVKTRRAFRCTNSVTDTTPLNVRRGAGPRAAIVGTIPDTTPVTIDRVHGMWVHLTAPLAGWAYAENVTAHCEPAAQ